jgi:hypothetical protein
MSYVRFFWQRMLFSGEATQLPAGSINSGALSPSSLDINASIPKDIKESLPRNIGRLFPR